jgi:hypothetical protein
VASTTRRLAIAIEAGRCTHDHLGCSCRGDQSVHDERAQEISDARSPELVDCPECGQPSTPLRIVTWGHCRACRTADSRAKSPLRW